ncbi:hypothetical protein PRIPAC_88140 [Pristionchus pacificus]|uniref:Uncharacterized protein n=1 Tax=Pristionchus pacificus TaxID=54126 RepID=A0A2A6CWP3_PRIPA|nr:hypothetical protein PRIPAC_88140 [Pristionchus pacificus]|eukprot:PDM82642.1 hypothetical protein PRIPAC_37035 [Pristionchus pacificus]
MCKFGSTSAGLRETVGEIYMSDTFVDSSMAESEIELETGSPSRHDVDLGQVDEHGGDKPAEGRSVTSLTSPALDHLPRHKVEKGGEDVDNVCPSLTSKPNTRPSSTPSIHRTDRSREGDRNEQTQRAIDARAQHANGPGGTAHRGEELKMGKM